MRGGTGLPRWTPEQHEVMLQYKRLLSRWLGANVTYTKQRTEDGKWRHIFSVPTGETLEITELLEEGRNEG